MSSSFSLLSIGELSRRAGVNIETIRYYERIGMLPAPSRTLAGRRVYEPGDAHRLAFIRRSRELGFSLDQIRALLALAAANGRPVCTEARALAADHLGEIRAKIADLQAMERLLSDAVGRCATDERLQCPVIEALSVS